MRAIGWALDEPDNEGHKITVEPRGVIHWGCSTHEFTDLAEIVSNIEKIKSQPDVWLTLRTTMGGARYVRVEGARLYAEQNNPSERAVNCDYEDFKAALLAAANSENEKGKG